LGVGVIQLIERTKLVSGERSVTVCVAVRGIEREKMIQEEKEYDRGGGGRILGKTRGSDK
jgi:hypothetical protein